MRYLRSPFAFGVLVSPQQHLDTATNFSLSMLLTVEKPIIATKLTSSSTARDRLSSLEIPSHEPKEQSGISSTATSSARQTSESAPLPQSPQLVEAGPSSHNLSTPPQTVDVPREPSGGQISKNQKPFTTSLVPLSQVQPFGSAEIKADKSFVSTTPSSSSPPPPPPTTSTAGFQQASLGPATATATAN